jgi:hypothetical protein
LIIISIGLVTVTVVDDWVSTVAGGTYNMAMATPSFGPGVTIVQAVPEPMSAVLLSLGGLLLRRRR